MSFLAPVTCRDIQHRIYWDYSNSSAIMLPNFAPVGWFECDVFRVTQAGYFYEYEVKVSLSDFHADKQKKDYCLDTRTWKFKGEMIRDRTDKSPHRFYYCVPEALTEKVLPILPDYAGLIELSRHLRIVRKAPMLHNHKFATHKIREAQRRYVARYWDLFLRWPQAQQIQRLERQLEEVKV